MPGLIAKCKTYKDEIRSVLTLALPLVFAELGWMLMGIVDVIMVGRLPDAAVAIGAVSLGTMAFYFVNISVSGLLMGMDPLVAQSFGAGNQPDCNRTLVAGFYLTLPLVPVLVAIVLGMMPILRMAGVDPAVMVHVERFTEAQVWSTLPLQLYFVLRHYLQCLNYVKIITFILVSANLVNWLFNWVFIYGHWGFPAMHVRGSAWATVLARTYMFLVAAGYLLYVNRRDKLDMEYASWWPDFKRIGEIIRLGAPAALQIALEISVFAIAAAMIGRLGPVPLASHQVALSVVACTYMVTLGISSAASVRVGQAIGAGEPGVARRAGWLSIVMGATFMACAALVLVAVPGPIARIFTTDKAVIAASSALLLIGAAFQLFDGVQVIATGALRGARETRIPMLSFLTGYWMSGLPLGYYLCFHAGWGARGFWIGFCVALFIAATVLVIVWHYKSRHLERLSPSPVEPTTEAQRRGVLQS